MVLRWAELCVCHLKGIHISLAGSSRSIESLRTINLLSFVPVLWRLQQIVPLFCLWTLFNHYWKARSTLIKSNMEGNPVMTLPEGGQCCSVTVCLPALVFSPSRVQDVCWTAFCSQVIDWQFPFHLQLFLQFWFVHAVQSWMDYEAMCPWAWPSRPASPPSSPGPPRLTANNEPAFRVLLFFLLLYCHSFFLCFISLILISFYLYVAILCLVMLGMSVFVFRHFCIFFSHRFCL